MEYLSNITRAFGCAGLCLCLMFCIKSFILCKENEERGMAAAWGLLGAFTFFALASFLILIFWSA